jgi:hypothetical protein
MNLDSHVDHRDIVDLAFALADSAAYRKRWGAPAGLAGDTDGDGDLDFDDIPGFVELLE